MWLCKMPTFGQIELLKTNNLKLNLELLKSKWKQVQQNFCILPL